MFMNNQIITVNGENGARAYQMLPNSSVILLDETAPLIWVKITDGAGYPKLTPYEIKEYIPPKPVDIQALKDNGLGGDALILILLFVMLGGGFWNKGNGSNNNYATKEDIDSAVNVANILNGQAELSADVQRTNYEQIGAVKDGNYNLLGEIRDVESMTRQGFSEMQRGNCAIERGIDGINYKNALNTADINSNIANQTQKILDRMSDDRIHLLEGRINELQLQSALCGVVRYPTQMTYIAQNPFCCSTSSSTTTTSTT